MMKFRKLFFWLALLIAACEPGLGIKNIETNMLESISPSNTRLKREVQIQDPEALFDLFNELGYTDEAWQAGVRDVPRLYLTAIPARWKDNSNKITVLHKKRLFFRVIAPLALMVNETILLERQRLLVIDINKASDADIEWLSSLALSYRVIKPEKANLTKQAVSQQLLDELKLRVDIVPISLVLAQAAEESGWGTSRFAIEGNALFGQWDYSGKGMKPKNYRKELGNYGVARFDSPKDSVAGYMRNLNTHRSYQRLRESRAYQRKQGQVINGFELARTLDKYSERGDAYVKSLHAMMSYNQLGPGDEAMLVGDEDIYLMP